MTYEQHLIKDLVFQGCYDFRTRSYSSGYIGIYAHALRYLVKNDILKLEYDASERDVVCIEEEN